MTHIYLAAPSSQLAELRGYRDQLKNLGFVVTNRWLDDQADLARVDSAVDAANSLDLNAADIVIVFSPGSHNGAVHTPYATALHAGKTCYVIGEPQQVSHSIAQICYFKEWHEALSYITCTKTLSCATDPVSPSQEDIAALAQRRAAASHTEGHLTFSSQGYTQNSAQDQDNSQKAQLHIITAPGHEEEFQTLIQNLLALLLPDKVDITASGNNARYDSSDTRYRAINPENEEERVKTAHITVFLGGPYSFRHEHCVKMFQLAYTVMLDHRKYNRNAKVYELIALNLGIVDTRTPATARLTTPSCKPGLLYSSSATDMILSKGAQKIRMAINKVLKANGLGLDQPRLRL